MHILIMGAGALGCYFGGRLQAAGQDITYVARGAHLEAMQARGLRIESPLGDLYLPEVSAVADPSEAPQPDVVMLMVKNRDVEAACARLRPVLGTETAVMTVQNGISAPDRVGTVLGAERVIAGTVFMPADIREPGVVRHSSAFHRLRAGVRPRGPLAALRALLDALTSAGIDTAEVPDVDLLLWNKFAMLASFAAITTLTRLDIGPIRETPETLALLKAAMEEAVAVGRVLVPNLPEDAAETHLASMTGETFPRNAHASMLDDLNRGKPLELEYLSGEIIRLGKSHGIPTPVHEMAYAALKPLTDGPAR